MPTLYGKATFEALLSVHGDGFATWLEVREDGAWVRPSLERDLPLRFSWTYSIDLDEFDGPDPQQGLALPFDFTAAQLAAFLLDGGAGIALTSVFGWFDEGPIESSLYAIRGVQGYRAVHALSEAYQAIRDAEAIVGMFDGKSLSGPEDERLALLLDQVEAEEEQVRRSPMTNREREPLLRQLHLRRQELGAKLNYASQERDERYFAWRKRMVFALLKPQMRPDADGADGLVLRLSHVLDDIERVEELRRKTAAASTSSFPEMERQGAKEAQLRDELTAARRRLAWLQSTTAALELAAAQRRHTICVMARHRRLEPSIPGPHDQHWDLVAATNASIDAEAAASDGTPADESVHPAVPRCGFAAADQDLTPPSASWQPKRPERTRGYGWPLYKILLQASHGGKPVPTVREVLDAFNTARPEEIANVTADGIAYYGGDGNLKTADRKAIGRAIARQISKGQRAGNGPL